MSERFSSLPYLETVHPILRPLLAGIIDTGSIDQLEKRVKLHRQKEAVVPLSQLAEAVMRIGITSVAKNPPLLLERGQVYYDTFGLVRLASNSLLCDEYLKSSERLGSERFITAVEIDDAFRKLPVRQLNILGIDLSTTPPSVIRQGQWFPIGFPDSLIAQETGTYQATVIDYVKYRVLRAPFNARPLINAYKEQLLNPKNRQALEFAINLVLFNGRGYPQQIILPDHNSLKPKLVAPYEGSDQDFLNDYFSETYCIGIPKEISMDKIALFVLIVNTGTLPPQNWQDYFAKVESSS